jgi:plasmid maintenance system antidote protein VapI
MMNSQVHTHVVSILTREFEQRRERKPSYSLRAFARFIELDPSHLSKVFRGQRGLSQERASAIFRKLGLDSDQIQPQTQPG